jgi:PAS domain S-box-containing protein
VSVNPVRDASGRIIGAVSCWRDVTQRFFVDRVIADNEKRLMLALSVAGMAIIDMDMQGGVIAGLSNGKAVLGFEIGAGEAIEAAMPRFLAAVHPDDRQKVAENQRQAMTNAGPFAAEFRVVHPDGSVVWIETRGETLADELGKPVRVLGTNVDMTARKRSEEHLRLVMRELTHRAKNLLAIIAALATQTARRNTTLEEFQQAFSRRIQGLGASHDLLVKTDWTGAPLADLVFFQIAPFGGLDGTRIAASGPPVMLKPDALQSLGLAINELATNAMKYGALSVPEGTVGIVWSVDRSGEEPRFRMSWTERGGPRVKPPRRKGFGHVIIETSLAQVLGGAVKLDFAPKGVTWTVDAPLNAIAPAQ